jgi:hypothetical protein
VAPSLPPSTRSGRRYDIVLEEHVASDLRVFPGDEQIASAGGQEVGHIGASPALHDRRHPLLEQQALEELGLGLVVRPPDLHEIRQPRGFRFAAFSNLAAHHAPGPAAAST